MKILILASTFPRYKNDVQPGFVSDLATALARYHDIYVLAPHDIGARYKEVIGEVVVYRFPYFLPGLEKLAYRGGMVNSFKESWLAKIQLPFYLLAQLSCTVYLVLAKKIDIINPHWLFPQGFIAYIAKKITGRKVLLTTHGGDIAILQERKIAQLLRRTVKGIDKITFVSEKNLAYTLQNMGLHKTEKYSVLPMGVHIPKALGNGSNSREILFIGRLVEIKGAAYLIRAFALVASKFPELSLRIAGEGPLRRELVELVNELGLGRRIRFEGFVREDLKDKLLRGADIVVIPSIVDKHGYQEGLPVVALEAMAYGKITIATKTGSLPSLIDGNNGVLVEPNNVEALAESLLILMSKTGDWPKMRKAAIKTARKYSWATICGQFLDLVSE